MVNGKFYDARHILLMFLAILLIFPFASDAWAAGNFAGGDGTKKKPYEIKTVSQFMAIANNLDKHFVLRANLDFKREKPVAPIGSLNKDALDMKKAFVGSFDGGGYTMSNLLIKAPGKNNVGIFGVVAGTTANRAEIKNLHIAGIGATGKDNVAALIGFASGSVEITNAHITGEPKVNVIEGIDSVGGILGKSEGNVIVKNCSTVCTIKGEEGLGGIAGFIASNSVVSDCRTVSKVIGEGHIGGFAGRVYGSISNSYSHSEVSAFGKDHDASGFAGTLFNSGVIEDCYSSGVVKGFMNVAGLVGRTLNYYAEGITPPEPKPKPTITRSHSFCSVKGASIAGGLVGNAIQNTIITNCYASGAVELAYKGDESDKDVEYRYHAGGLVGKAGSGIEITNCYSTGDVSGDEGAAGLVGYLGESSFITASYANGNVTGLAHIGGLVGRCYGGIDKSHSSGNVVLNGDDHDAGGIAGSLFNKGFVTNSYSTGSISGHQNIGGIVGRAFVYYTQGKKPAVLPNPTISNCVAYGEVHGKENIGGIVGFANENAAVKNNVAFDTIVGENIASTGKFVGKIAQSAQVTGNK